MVTERPHGIPEVVILRLPLYVRVLTQLQQEEATVVSSRGLGVKLGVTPAQIRKDLSYFGRFGKQGRGYNVTYLLRELRQVLGLDRQWNTAVIGVGRLGRAIISYPGFAPEGFRVVAAFDADPAQLGRRFDDVTVLGISELEGTIRARDISIAIVAVPAPQAQEIINQLMRCGIKAILNYAPIAPQVAPDVRIRNIDPVLGLQTMTYHLKRRAEATREAMAAGG